jgi:hypothetical protein
MSPFAGGEDLLFIHRALERGGAWFYRHSPLPASRSWRGSIFRYADLVTIWMPIDFFTMVVQHEIFGHGFRIRSCPHASVDGYAFDWPFPYGSSGGATSYTVDSAITVTELSAIATGGVEATAQLAIQTKWKWIEAGLVHPKQTILYLTCQHDLDLYIGTLPQKIDAEETLDGHDIIAYLKALNTTYPNAHLSKETLKLASLVNLIDPFTYAALYAWFSYIVTGKESPLPMLRAGDWLWTAGARLGLTPFGPEYYAEAFFSHEERPFYLYLRGGAHAGNGYWGVGAFAPTIRRFSHFSWGLRCDLWAQPDLLLYPGAFPVDGYDFDTPPDPAHPLYTPAQRSKRTVGAACSLLLRGHFLKRGAVEAEAGYKSEGFLEGVALQASPIIRASVNVLF